MPLEIHPLLAQRRSPRAIDPNRPVPREVTQRLLEAARWAPSSGNSQPWRFVVIDAPEALARAREALHPGNQRWANRAPLLLLICANPQDDGDINGQPLYLFDCGLAAENLLLQGTAEGLVVHPMAGWDEVAMRAAMNVPEPYRVVVVIAVGYPGRLEDLPEDLQKRETAPRARKPLSELTHYNGW
ncbi:MAG TPA: nitroreductase family protein [Chthonomonas sp.]|jgi:nitroreductase|uniref:nitroreductase family protein n=1 Tax=Chthonomonas sp. TaxID=2282153 RepID=UPI002B4ABB50|nr:nitroreductase family protein [Chthonomonas sp.]HLH79338.1 nitroreductase family protein [Chthonomonas sp.]